MRLTHLVLGGALMAASSGPAFAGQTPAGSPPAPPMDMAAMMAKCQHHQAVTAAITDARALIRDAQESADPAVLRAALVRADATLANAKRPHTCGMMAKDAEAPAVRDPAAAAHDHSAHEGAQ